MSVFTNFTRVKRVSKILNKNVFEKKNAFDFENAFEFKNASEKTHSKKLMPF